MNSLDEEIDLLIDDTLSNPSSTSSAFENLSSWHNDYFQNNNFYPNFFPTDVSLPMLSSSSATAPSTTTTTTNIDTDNSTNPLTFM